MQITKSHKIVNKNIEDLKYAEYNPRQLSKDQFKHLKDSLDRFGFVDPVIVNKNPDRENIIIGGHQRVKVAKKLGMLDVPCIELDLSYDKEKELNVRLNKNTGDWDYDILVNNFNIDDLVEFGFDDSELKIDLPEDEKENLMYDDLKSINIKVPEKVYNMWISWKNKIKELNGYETDSKAFEFAIVEANNTIIIEVTDKNIGET